MKFEIIEFFGRYQIVLEHRSNNHSIADYLNLAVAEYRNILIRNGSYKLYINDEHFFRNRYDVERAIKELEPILVMAELMR